MSIQLNREPVLAVEHLQTTFFTDKETIRAVDDISYTIREGETVGIVGESGSGKSVTARSIMGLVDSPGRIMGGSIRFSDPETVERLAGRFPKRTVDVDDLRQNHDVVTLVERLFDDGVTPEELTDGEYDVHDAKLLVREGDVDMRRLVERGYTTRLGVTDEEAFVVRDGTGGYVEVTNASKPALRALRGKGIAMIFQDPLTSLNPVYTVGNQIKEAVRLHQGKTGQAATDEAIRLLEAVSIPDARRRIDEYPHQFSGGMRQRAVIAMALACKPKLLICDEPTTALDVTIQAQILELLDDIQAERDLAIMFITHDMGVIAEVADRVNVMYSGELVESAPVEELFASPKHPYTRGLLESIPGRNVGEERLRTIEGDVPTPNEQPTYCRFAPRCPEAFDACDVVHPVNVDVSDEREHTAACLLYPEELTREDAVAYHRAQGDGAQTEVTHDE
ncbi:ABC transporter ATP-binding protein [Halomarina ordinaria]|uniref:Nickel import system ATP-binding protein NikD n=1 Tax=Halomarina ordinaria TaxID=3033939 RepID=A0ABD5U945_9EURY|nr:ABC transporter ATP-binding protein [Halomarina sp. PSRA2]